MYRKFNTFANLEPLEFEVPMICLVTGQTLLGPRLILALRCVCICLALCGGLGDMKYENSNEFQRVDKIGPS
jgi:hypothetical protein